ncbi:MAG: exonuclease SbcCD subunit D C-terminal domain-containing protein, partial [Clostridia bacterium]|nr:exonuclease SbcCD subunit D C-terminal domain-containing protein [Clostridia bacterium]
DFIYAVLTDEEYIDNPAGHLRTVYPNLLNVRYKASGRTGYTSMEMLKDNAETRSPLELFIEFYKQQNDGADPDLAQEEILKNIISEIWGEENETD